MDYGRILWGRGFMSTQKLTVAKFGGTSLANFTAMSRCAAIVADDVNTQVVVVSAPSGVTNHLVALSHIALNGGDRKSYLAQINVKIQAIVEELNATDDLRNTIQTLLADLEVLTQMLCRAYSEQLVDELLSFGERFSVPLFTAVLQKHGVNAIEMDARKVIVTNSHYGNAEPQINRIAEHAQQHIAPLLSHYVVIMAGFIGSNSQGITTTLGRGGSDYTVSLIAEALTADAVKVWTDVAGIYEIDPRLKPGAKAITEITFSEAAELATFGAKVLHPATLWPAMRQAIPVFVGSSIEPQQKGTWIRPTLPNHLPCVRALALRKSQTLLTVHSLNMLHAQGFLAKVFTVLAEHHISIDLITTSEVSVAMTVDNYTRIDQEVIEALEALGNIKVILENGLALVAVIGNRLQHTPGVSGRVFQTVANVNIRLLCHGASEHNLCFLVAEADGPTCIHALHRHFFNQGHSA